MTETSFFGTHHQSSVALEGYEGVLKLRLPQKRLVQAGETLGLLLIRAISCC